MESFLDVCNASSSIFVTMSYIGIIIAVSVLNTLATDLMSKGLLITIFILLLSQIYFPSKLNADYTDKNRDYLKYSLFGLSGILVVLNIIPYYYNTYRELGSTPAGQKFINLLVQLIPAIMATIDLNLPPPNISIKIN